MIFQLAFCENSDAQKYFDIGSKFALGGNFDSAHFYLNKSIDFATAEKDTAILLRALNTLAMRTLESGKRQEALDKFDYAIDIAQRCNDTLFWGILLQNKSHAYGTYGFTDYEKSLTLLLQAADLQAAIEEWATLASIYKSISSIFKEMGNNEKREFYLQEAANIIESHPNDDKNAQAQIYNELGRYYSDENKNYEKAEDYYRKVLEICKELGWKRGVAASLTNIAYIREQQEKYSEALNLQYESLAIKEELRYTDGLINSYHSIGDLLIKQNNIPLAIQNLLKAKKIAEESNKLNFISEIYLSLYNAYKLNEEYKKALFYHEKHLVFADSVKSISHARIVEELNTKYETKEKEQRIEELEYEQQVDQLKTKARKQQFITIVVVLLLIIVIVSTIYLRRRILSRERESNLNQKLLRSQMNPHFIFNSLNSINTYIVGNKPAEAGLFLSQFAKLMRNILDSTRKETITLERELETLNYYLRLEKLRFQNKFDYQINVSDDINPDDTDIPPMLLQPFIENSIKHAFTGNSENAMITVDIKNMDENLIKCEIIDNGVGINHSKSNKNHKSYGSNITTERLKYLNRKKKSAVVINIVDREDEGTHGTRVTLTIPV